MATPSSSGSQSLVGREREFAALREYLSAALTGHGGLVLIGGEAGIGKTTLAEAICREAAARGVRVLVGRCYDLTETPPYGPWIECFGQYRQDDGMPSLPDAFAERGILGNVESQPALFQRVLDFFVALAALCPAAVLLDDLHWSDPASLDLLRFLARNLAALPLLIVVTYRSEEAGRDRPLNPLLPTLVRESGAQRVVIRPLAQDAMAAWVAARYRLSAADAERLVVHLAERAEGNPLFVGELLRSLEEADVLHQRDGRWLLGDLTDRSIPQLLRAIIDMRIARLSMEGQRLLGIAAVIGAVAPYRLWMAVAGVDEDVLLETVTEAEATHVMAEGRDGTGAAFTHALIREALYEGIRPSERRRWHRAAGEVLAALPGADPDAVANHLVRAGDARATVWLIQAGNRAARAYAWMSAADRFQAALSLIEENDANAGERGWLLFRLAALRRWDNPQTGVVALEEAEQLAFLAHDQGLAAYAIFQRGMSRCIAGDLRRGVPEMEAGAAARRAFSAEERARLNALLQPLTILDDTDGQGPLSQWLATVGRYADARSVGERALEAMPDGGANGSIFLGLGQAYAGLGMPEAARAAFARTRQIAHAAGNDFQVGMNAGNEVKCLLPFIADRPAEVRRLYDEMAASWARAVTAMPDDQRRFPHIAQRLWAGDWEEAIQEEATNNLPPAVRQYRGTLLGPAFRARGETEQAWAVVRTLLPDGPATEPGNTNWFIGAQAGQRLAAALALDAGDPETARAWLIAHQRWTTWSGGPIGRADGALGWAAYHRVAGSQETAIRWVEEGMRLAAEPRQPLVLLAARRLRGELALDCKDDDGAEQHLTEALALAQACNAPYERALTLLLLAQKRMAADASDAARILLDEARSICAPLGAKPALACIDALMTRLHAERSAAAAYPAGLTTREAEVLRLMAAGKTNREIADTLFLSPRTINIHVTHILTKTNTANRVEAAAFALRHGIA